VNSVVVGESALFQVEHSEHEPELVFVKSLSEEKSQSNLTDFDGKRKTG